MYFCVNLYVVAGAKPWIWQYYGNGNLIVCCQALWFYVILLFLVWSLMISYHHFLLIQLRFNNFHIKVVRMVKPCILRILFWLTGFQRCHKTIFQFYKWSIFVNYKFPRTRMVNKEDIQVETELNISYF